MPPLSIKTMPLEKSSIDFPKGFSIITGETGAGKSIIRTRFSIRKRADLSSLKNKDEKCIIKLISKFLNTI
jgi:DNA repair protein RecN (Recombination protein N)